MWRNSAYSWQLLKHPGVKIGSTFNFYNCYKSFICAYCWGIPWCFSWNGVNKVQVDRINSVWTYWKRTNRCVQSNSNSCTCTCSTTNLCTISRSKESNFGALDRDVRQSVVYSNSHDTEMAEALSRVPTICCVINSSLKQYPLMAH